MRAVRFACLAAMVLLALPAPASAGYLRAPTHDRADRSTAAPTTDAPPVSTKKRPTLILAISVDQFSADLFSQYRRFYVAGLQRLQDGAVFPQGFQSHAATETCPGHSTLMTGDRPARTGIIANDWWDPSLARKNKAVYCVEDETDPASTSKFPVVTANHLLVPTLGERIKAAYPGSRNVAVSGKDRAAIMMGGHAIDAVYWYRNDRTGKDAAGDDLPATSAAFVTLPGRDPSPAAKAQNAVLATMLRIGAPAYAVPPTCAAKDAAIRIDDLSIGTGRFALAPGKPDALRISPRIDAMTVDLALRLVDEMQLGGRAAPDVLSVSLSANDYVGHAYGTAGLEMCIQQTALDRTIGTLLTGLDRRGIDYIVVLTADHGGFDVPERLDQQALPIATRATHALSPDTLNQALIASTGITPPAGKLIYGSGAGGDYYVARNITPDQRRRVIAALARTLHDDPQVALAMTADDLAQVPMPASGSLGGSPQDFTLVQRARASFYAPRSGDVVALLKRGVIGIVTPSAAYTATHGSPWDYDRRVPILFWRKGMRGFEQPAPIETVDIAPTLAAIAGLTVAPGEMDGRCLDLDAGPGDTCATR